MCVGQRAGVIAALPEVTGAPFFQVDVAGEVAVNAAAEQAEGVVEVGGR